MQKRGDLHWKTAIPQRIWTGMRLTRLRGTLIRAFLKTRQGKSPLSKLPQTINPTRTVRGQHDKAAVLCADTRHLIKMSHMLEKVPKRAHKRLFSLWCLEEAVSLPGLALFPWSCPRSRCRPCWACFCRNTSHSRGCEGTGSPPTQSQTPLKRSHWCREPHVVVAATQTCRWESWMTDFVPLRFAGVSEDARLGLADKVSKGVHFQGAVQIYVGTQRRQKAALLGFKQWKQNSENHIQ